MKHFHYLFTNGIMFSQSPFLQIIPILAIILKISIFSQKVRLFALWQKEGIFESPYFWLKGKVIPFKFLQNLGDFRK